MKLRFGPLTLLVLLGISSAAGQTFSEFPAPSGAEPHPAWITAGPDGNLWFTLRRLPAAPYVCRITPEGAITQFPVPTVPARVNQITTGPDGNLWFTEILGNRIGRATTSGSVTEFPIPTPDSEPDGIATGPDGAL